MREFTVDIKRKLRDGEVAYHSICDSSHGQIVEVRRAVGGGGGPPGSRLCFLSRWCWLLTWLGLGSEPSYNIFDF